jgi:hypothetical protein
MGLPIPVLLSTGLAARAEGVEARRQTSNDNYGLPFDEGMVQTTNPKGAAKAVVCTHNPLVAGSNPAGPIFPIFPTHRLQSIRQLRKIVP